MTRQPWTEIEVRELQNLWEIKKISEIARHLGRSVDSVAGKGRDLGFTPRLALRRDKVAPLREKAPVRPLRRPEKAPLQVGVEKALLRKKAPLRPSTEPLRVEHYQHPLLRVGPGGCLWPIGDPRHPAFHFCADRVVEGRVYCEQHVRKAYYALSYVPRDKLAKV
jgi:GcrA cell cycle regulator